MGAQQHGRRTAIVLTALLVLFIARVVAQLSQVLWPNSILPPFSAWQSGLLPYPILFLGQAAIVVASLWVIAAMARGTLRTHRVVGAVMLTAGMLYFGFMTFRLVAGLTFLSGSPFFGAVLPAIFHLVLASMLIITALYLRRDAGP